MKRKKAPQSYESQQKKGVTKKPKLTLQSYDHKLLMKLKKSIYQHEKKFIDVAITGGAYALAGGATIQLLNGLNLGTDESNRIGRQITMKTVQLRGVVYAANTTVGQGAIRTIIVLDQEVPQSSSIGQTMLITDFLVSDGLSNQLNLNNRKRFKVLMDRVDELSGCTVNTGNPQTQVFNFYKKIDLTAEFNANSNGTITDFTKNAIYLITYSVGLTVTVPVNNLNSRIST
jgi:hypothetical protein